ncbi:MAG: hypothetical protein K2J90_06850 [Lachnospiraceae bacterium]|nr:hypothetical protein [Lachnospiraceae bacterium]
MASIIQMMVENDPYATMREEEILEKLKRAREHCEEGKCREMDQVVSVLREKYGLHSDYCGGC